MILQDKHSFIGMRTDNTPVTQESRFLRDAYNIRFTDIDNSSFLALTNERGNKKLELVSDYEKLDNIIYGTYIGHCIVGEYLVIFTHSNIVNMGIFKDHIYAVYCDKATNQYILKHIYEGNNLHFMTDYPLQTLGVIEGDSVYKVYWTDGVNPPRVINILQKELLINSHYRVDADGTILDEKYIKDQLDVNLPAYDIIYGKDTNYIFDFVPELQLKETITVTKQLSGGMFSSGTIQYAFTYYNKYGKESNIFYTTELNYISYDNRGGSEKDVIPNSFYIEIKNYERIFDFVRIYSIHRTSQDAVPTVKILTDIEITKYITDESLIYIDTGTTGDIVDPTRLLYIGGEDIVVGTIATKDNTLFLGNITINRPTISTKIKDEIKKDFNNNNYNNLKIKKDSLVLNNYKSNSFYPYDSQLNYGNPATFMPGDTYRFGIQFQYKNGKWSEPIYCGDYTIQEINRPILNNNILTKINYTYTPNSTILSELYNNGYRKIRGLIVMPTVNDMTVLAYGVVNPTIFSSYNRQNNTPYSQSSWFFRPIGNNITTTTNSTDIMKGATIPFRHLEPLLEGKDRGCEIQNNTKSTIDNVNNIIKQGKEINSYFVDQNIVTFHSPDIEFNNSIRQYISRNEVKFDIVGITPFKNSAGDISIQTSTPPCGAMDSGFKHFTTYSTDYSNRILCAGLFYNSHPIDDNRDKLEAYNATKNDFKFNWMIFPWHRNGSLNNDSPRADGVKSADLKKKVISNIRVSIDNEYFKQNDKYWTLNLDITKMEIFDNDEIGLTKIDTPLNSELNDISYYGNIDTLSVYKNIITNSGVPSGYNFYCAPPYGTAPSNVFTNIPGISTTPIANELTTNQIYPLSNVTQVGDKLEVLVRAFDAARIKYKSSKHGVFAFNYYKNESGGVTVIKPTILPSIYDKNKFIKPSTTPFWEKLSFTLNNISKVSKSTTNTYKKIDYAFNLATSNTKVQEEDILQEIKDNIPNPNVGDLVLTIDMENSGNINKAAIYIYTISNSWTKASLTTTDNFYYVVNSDTLFPILDATEPDSIGFWKVIDSTNGKVERCTITEKDEEGNIIDVPISSMSSYDIYQPIINEENFINIDKQKLNSFLYLGKIYKEESTINNRYGGTTKEALKNNLWIPSGEAHNIVISSTETTECNYASFKYGDTYYMRYDCLKTQPFTEEDQNGIVDIASFMCLTRINLDGKYDENRGLLSNLNIRKTNFNLINDIYNQKDNYFNYRLLDDYYYGINKYPNQFLWSLQKNNLEEIDTWTNITLANSYDVYNNCGKINSINIFNDNLYIFQDRGFSQLMFNNRVQIPVSDGVPVEISNNNKVTGIRDISTNIGCSNFRLITTTPSALYFIDNNTDRIYSYSDKLKEVSTILGNNKWFKEHSKMSKYPYYYLTFDKIYNDIYAISKDNSFCLSENMGQFTSKYTYNSIMDNYLDKFISINTDYKYDLNDISYDTTNIWLNREGEYNKFYDNVEYSLPYFSYISNDNPQVSKIFDNVEFTMDIYTNKNNKYTIDPLLSFNTLEVSNSYQTTGNREFDNSRDINKDYISLRKKFNVWRCLIPRQIGTRNRIRDTWAEIKLGFSTINNKNFRFILNSLITKYNV